MTDEQKAVIEELRSEGYAIAIITPEEVCDADPENIEDIMRERGLNVAATA